MGRPPFTVYVRRPKCSGNAAAAMISSLWRRRNKSVVIHSLFRECSANHNSFGMASPAPLAPLVPFNVVVAAEIPEQPKTSSMNTKGHALQRRAGERQNEPRNWNGTRAAERQALSFSLPQERATRQFHSIPSIPSHPFHPIHSNAARSSFAGVRGVLVVLVLWMAAVSVSRSNDPFLLMAYFGLFLHPRFPPFFCLLFLVETAAEFDAIDGGRECLFFLADALAADLFRVFCAFFWSISWAVSTSLAMSLSSPFWSQRACSEDAIE